MSQTPGSYESQKIEGPPGSGGESPLVSPVFHSSTYRFPDTKTLAAVAGGEKQGYFYTRYTSPNFRAAEIAISALEGAEDGLVFSSGMAASACTVLSFVRAGERIAAFRDLYGGTTGLFKFLEPFGVQTQFVDTGDYEALDQAAQGAKLIWCETPTNPLCRIVDLAKLAAIGKRYGAKTAVDSTFASPINQQPLSLGMDLVMHSATKYLGGHSDLTAGVICGRREDLNRIEKTRRILGGVMDPAAAWLLERSLKTLDLRVAQINKSAMQVAQFLSEAKGVAKTHYAGLPSHPDHALAKKQMRGFGGMMSCEIEGGDEMAFRFADRLKVFSIAASLGGVESLVSHPVLTSHRFSPEERQRQGIKPGLVRLSIGVESAEDLIADLKHALV